MKEHKQMYYFETAKDRPSSVADGVNVLAWNGECWKEVYYKSLWVDTVSNEDPADYYTHWMQMPKAPNSDDRSF